MKHYEITFIVDPVLSGDEIKKTAKAYTSLLENEKCGITFHNEMGLQQLAYPINKRQSGIYFCTEFTTESGEIIPKMELAMRRDERVIRFLTVKLDKYGVKYNDDKRNGLIGSKKKAKKEDDTDKKDDKRTSRSKSTSTKSAAPVKAAAKATPEKEVKVVEKAAPVKIEEKVTTATANVTDTKESSDELTKIEGIGPKIASLLIGAGINTFAKLSSSEVDNVKSILADAGSRYSMHDPSTWPAQAGMAAEGKWDELKKWQDELDGGKPAAKNEEE